MHSDIPAIVAVGGRYAGMGASERAMMRHANVVMNRARRGDTMVVLVAEHEGEVCGFVAAVWGHANEGMDSLLVLTVTHLVGRKCLRALLDAIEEERGEHPVVMAVWDTAPYTTKPKDGARLIRALTRLGYAPVGVALARR